MNRNRLRDLVPELLLHHLIEFFEILRQLYQYIDAVIQEQWWFGPDERGRHPFALPIDYA
jgi:hypothetical protein